MDIGPAVWNNESGDMLSGIVEYFAGGVNAYMSSGETVTGVLPAAPAFGRPAGRTERGRQSPANGTFPPDQPFY